MNGFKMCDIFLVFFFFLCLHLLCEATAGTEATCSLRVIFDDTAGDGWNRNYLTATTGSTSLNFVDQDGSKTKKATCLYGSRAIYTLLNISDGQTIKFEYVPAGKWQTENLWSVEYDNSDSPVLLQGAGSPNRTSSSLTVSCCCVPDAVTDLTVDLDEDRPYYANLSWDAVEYAVAYDVSGSKDDNYWRSYGEFNDTNITLFLSPSSTYRFRVAAVSNLTQGPWSDAVSVTTEHYNSCNLTTRLHDNFDDDMERDGAHLAVTVGAGLAAYRSFDSRSGSFTLEIPQDSVFTIASDILGRRQTEDLEYVFLSSKNNKEFFHSGGNNFNVNNTFNISCRSIEAPHLLSMGGSDEDDGFHILSMESPIAGTDTSQSRSLQQTRCTYALFMNDTAGNGWTGGMSMSIYLNGQSWTTGLSCPSGYAWYRWSWWVTSGTQVGIYFIRGTDPNPTQASYRVTTYDNNVVGSTIATQGPGMTSLGNSFFTCGGSGPSCPSNCASLNRNNCPSGASTCGTCRSGFTASDGTTNSNANSQCSASQTCPSTTTCNNLNRNPCQTAPNCGTCKSGFTASDGTTNSFANSQCTSSQSSCPSTSTCTGLNRNACQSGSTTCGTCFSGYTAASGSAAGSSLCYANCPTNCATLNRQNCQVSFPNPRTCGPCNSGFTAADGTTNSNSNSRCTATGPSDPCGTRIRRDWFSLSASAQDQWIRAVIRYYNLNNNANWRSTVQIHNTYASQTHGTALFLYWHRQFIYYWENELRTLGGEFACITQPYWDWTIPANINNMLANTVSGGLRTALGVKNGQCFGSGHPFQNFQYNGNCVSRSAWTTPRMTTSQALGSQISATNQYATARPIIEARHNDLHNWVGNNMAQVPISPSDPLFWVHHAFIDLIFATWQVCMGANSESLPPTNANINQVWESNSPYSFTNAMPGWSQSPMNVYNLPSAQNVKYERTWLSQAYPSGGCNQNTAQWLQWFTEQRGVEAKAEEVKNQTGKHLMSNNYVKSSVKKSGGKKFHTIRGHFRPSKAYQTQQESIYETYKETLISSNNTEAALDQAFLKSCLMLPPLTEQQAWGYWTPEMIRMMNFEDECAAGYCVDPCWNRTHNLPPQWLEQIAP